MRNSTSSMIIIAISFISIGFALIYEQYITKCSAGILLFLIVLFVLIALCVIVRHLVVRHDKFEIIVPLLITFTFYSMMLPINFLIDPEYTKSIPNIIVFQYMIVCLVGLTFLIVGYYSPIPRNMIKRMPVLSITKRDITIAAFLLLVFGIVSFISNIISFGGIGNFIAIGYGAKRHVIMKEVFAFGSGLELIGISSILLMFQSFSDKKRLLFIIYSAMLLSILSITLLIGHRRIIIYIILMAFILFHYKVLRMKTKWFLLAGIFAYVFFTMYAHTRAIWARVGIVKGIEATYQFVVEHPNLMLPYVGGEFIPPAHAVIEMLNDDAMRYHYGTSYIIGFVRIFPRVGRMWPDDLKVLAEWRLDEYYPGLSGRGVGYAFATIAEGYANFGYFGVILHMFIYGVLARSVYLYFKKNSGELFAVIVYAGFFPLLLFEGIRAESSQLLWVLSHTYLGPLIFILVLLKIVNYTINQYIIHESPAHTA